MADSLNRAEECVATQGLDDVGWEPVLPFGVDVIEGIRRITATDWPDLIVWRRWTLMQVLIDNGPAG